MAIEGGSPAADTLASTRAGGAKSSARAPATESGAQAGFALLMDSLLPGREGASDAMLADGAALSDDEAAPLAAGEDSQALDLLLSGLPALLPTPTVAQPEAGGGKVADAGGAVVGLRLGLQAGDVTVDLERAQGTDASSSALPLAGDEPDLARGERTKRAHTGAAQRAEVMQAERAAAAGEDRALRVQDTVPVAERRMEAPVTPPLPVKWVEAAQGHGSQGVVVAGLPATTHDAAQPSSAPGVSSFVDTDAAPASSRQVAEQVHFWMTHDIQNAELRLAAQGQDAVEIHIAMQGRQARVEFFCNQAEVRQLLEDSVAHLRELLHEDGLVLAGVMVGSSDARQSSPQGRPGGGRLRQTGVIAAAEEAPAGALAQPWTGQASAGGRKVDLYV